MRDGAKLILLGIGLVVSVLIIDYFGILWESFTGPQREEMRRDIWENTRSFKEGKQQELVRYLHQYNMSKDVLEKKAIASTVRLNFADVDTSNYQPVLKEFLNKCFSGVVR